MSLKLNKVVSAVLKVLACGFFALTLFACGGSGGGSSSGSSETNNGTDSGTNNSGDTIDVAITAFSLSSSSINAGEELTINVTVENRGSTINSPGVVFFISTDNVISLESDTSISLTLGAITFAPGQSISTSTSVTIPENLRTGEYFIGALAPFTDVDQTPANNTAVQPLSIAGTTCDEDPYEQDDTAQTAGYINIDSSVVQLRNHCDDALDWLVFDAVAGTDYGFSVEEVGDDPSVIIALFTENGALNSGAEQPLFTDVTFSNNRAKVIWQAPESGRYYFVTVPFAGLLDSGADTEYRLEATPAIADIGVEFSLTSSSNTYAIGGLASINVNVSNRGFADSPAFRTGIYLSTDEQVDSNDLFLSSIDHTALAVDESDYSGRLQTFIPSTVAPGTYYIAAITDDQNTVLEYDENNNTSAVFPVTLEALDCTVDSYEQDDSVSQASAIVLGQTQERNHCDDAYDWLTFNADAGTAYVIDVNYSPYATGVEATLYDTDGTTVLASDEQIIRWTAPASGQHFIEIQPISYIGAEKPTDYSVTLAEEQVDLNLDNIFHYDDSIIVGGVSSVSLRMSNLGYSTIDSFSANIYLSTDAVIDTADLLVGSETFNSFSQQSVDIAIPSSVVPGTYYLGAILDPDNSIAELSESNNRASTEQSLSLIAPVCGIDSYEDNDSATYAGLILPGDSQQHNFCDDGIDYFDLSASADTLFLFTIEELETFGLPQVEIQDDEGNRVEGINQLRDFDRVQLAWEAEAAGDYRLLLNNTVRDQSSYRITRESCIRDEFENNDTASEARPISLGVEESHNHCDDNADWFVLQAEAGLEYQLVTRNLQANADTIITLYDTNGMTRLAENDNVRRNNPSSELIWLAPAAGQYYIRVSGKQLFDNTGYSFRVDIIN